jgi:hypothetical protein
VKITPLKSQGTQAGTYDLLGRLTLTPATGGATSSRVLSADEASLTIAKHNDTLNFTLNAQGIVPGGAIAFPSPEIFWSPTLTDPTQIFESDQTGKWPQFLGQRLTAYRVAADGTEEAYMSYDFRRGWAQSVASGTATPSALTYDIGYSYVAMGEWASSVVQLGARPPVDVLFVNGARTPQSGIPVSGKATYAAHTLSLLAPSHDSAYPGIAFTLTADFGLRTIATRIDQDYQHYLDQMGYGEAAIRGAAILGIHVGGSAPFSKDGSFDIPLTGTVNYSAINAIATPPSEPVTGAMNGAFFGPHAEEIGGTFSLDRGGGNPPIQDAFVGQQKPH